MDSTESISTGDQAESKVPKLRRSCEACRATKGKCIPSKDNENRCQRCINYGKDCVFLSPKPRPKRAKNSRIRVAEMEEKLDGLLAMMSHQNSQSANNPSVHDEHVIEPHSAQASKSTPPPSYTKPQATFQFGNAPFQPLNSPSYTVFDEFGDVISRGLLDSEQAEESLRFFRCTADSFPFVVIPAHTSLDFLRRERPFLLLAILAMATQSNLKLQAFLEQELRETMSKKVMMNGEQSLDLLQGILVYLAWYHFFFNPERQQIYQLTQIAITMAVDLGITKPSGWQSVDNGSLVLFSAEKGASRPREKPKPMLLSDSERKRAFLGSYYLSSALCISLRKPNNLKYNTYIEECGESLATASEEDSDRLIPYYIQLQHVYDDVNRTFDFDGHGQLANMDPVRIELFVKTFEQQLLQMENEFPPDFWNNGILSISFYHLSMYVHEVGFHASPPAPVESPSNRTSTTTWYEALSRNEVLIKCLDSTKKFMDHYLALPPLAVRRFTAPDYIRLTHTYLMLGRFTLSIETDAPLLDAVQIRKSANLEYYNSALLTKLEGLLSYTPDGQVLQDYISQLLKLFRLSKGWFSHLNTGSAGALGDGHDKSPEMSFLEAIPIVMSRSICVEPPATEKQMSQDELWTDMMEPWPMHLDPYDVAMDIPFE